MTSIQPVDDDRIRVGDAEREQLADRLARAHAAGQLDLDEFDTRVQQAYQARVRVDLDVLTADLPPEAGAPRGARGPRRGTGPRTETSWRIDTLDGPSVNDAVGVHRGASRGCAGRPPWSGGSRNPGHRPGASMPRPVLIVLAVLLALWLVGPLLELVLRVAVLAVVIAAVAVAVRAVRRRRRR